MCDGWDIKEDRVSSPLGQNWRLKLKLIGGNCTKVSGSQTPVQFTECHILRGKSELKVLFFIFAKLIICLIEVVCLP